MSQQTTDEFDPFKTSSGLKDDFDGTVIDGWWGTDPNSQQNPAPLLGFLKIIADDGEEVEARYSTGSGWNSYDGGVTVEHEKDGAGLQYFNNRTAWAECFTKAMESGAESEMRRRSQEELNNRGPRNIGGMMKGLKFHWNVKTETFNMKDRQTGEQREVTSNRLLPTAFLGVVGGATQTLAPATQPSPVPSNPAMQPSQPLSVPAPSNLAPQSGGSGPMPAATGPSPTASPAPAPQSGVGQPGAPASPAPSAPSAQQQAPAAAEAPTTAEAAPDWSWWAQLPPEMQTAISNAAKANAYPQFVDEVLSLTGAADNGSLVTALGDENLYTALRAQ